MKIQCDVCERSKATVICCADEAALCTECDKRVHTANKLANKHQRIPFLAPTDAPRCDICQEKSGFFFCVDDRALLCRHCDLSIHSANSLSSNHKRFLIPGIQVALMAVTVHEVTEAAPQETPQYGLPSSKMSNPKAQRSPESLSKSSITEFLTDAASGWRVDELLNLADLSEGYSAANLGSSKTNLASFGDFDWTADLSLFEEESFHEVPQLPSPPATSGLYRSTRMAGSIKNSKQDVALVPDLGDAFVVPDLHLDASPPPSPPRLKQRRSCYDI
ncbi:unnamed protein product [Sphagnum troendelagicum]|uniref:B box-type domain-containing protein n=2 Tax=Sphagnum TaxID=13804 RepID=A0ABP0UZW8_9BRYO